MYLPVLALVFVLCCSTSLSNAGLVRRDWQDGAKFEFIVPTKGTVWKQGEKVPIKASTYGLGSFWGVGVSKLFLLDAEGKRLNGGTPIMEMKEINFIDEERVLGIGRPRWGKGETTWSIPRSLKDGKYQLEYESSTLNWDRTRFVKKSPPFWITQQDPKSLEESKQSPESVAVAQDEKKSSPDQSPNPEVAPAPVPVPAPVESPAPVQETTNPLESAVATSAEKSAGVPAVVPIRNVYS
ncbi:hypothetical protein BKA69DRAFT_1094743 [Paraphysoderma sedebokerense]|nr:hypothetical protein BKA69DRAFT_1094743 [Paraphysoderma sedebokerense]